MKITKELLEILVKKIEFNEYYIEATFQFRLLMELARRLGEASESRIFPERNIEIYCRDSGYLPKGGEWAKKEIDIVIADGKKIEAAIELKMPMNGQVPEQMFKFVEDIKFLEQIKLKDASAQCFLIVVTNNHSFWRLTGRKEEKGSESIYSYFRGENAVVPQGVIIEKPTGEKGKKYKLDASYDIKWKDVGDAKKEFRYFITETKPTARS